MYLFVLVGLFIKPHSLLGYLPKGAATAIIPSILIILCIWIYTHKKLDFEVTLFLLLSLSVLSIFHLAWTKNNTLTDLIVSFSSFTFFFSSIFIPFFIFKRLSRDQVHHAVSKTSYTIAAIVFLDAIIRFFLPFIGLKDDQLESYNQTSSVGSFYQYKYASIIEFDSNFVAIYCGAFIFLNLFIRHPKYKIHLWIWLGLLLSTLSRSVIISTLLVLFIYRLRDLNVSAKGFIIILTVCLFSFILFKESFLLNDDSLQSKFQILSSLKDVFNRDPSFYLFGYGPKQGQFMYSFEKDHFAHAAPALLLGIVGIIGTLAYLAFWIYMMLRCNKIMYLFIYSMICGFSLFLPFDYCTFIICGSIMAYCKFHLNDQGQKIEFTH